MYAMYNVFDAVDKCLKITQVIICIRYSQTFWKFSSFDPGKYLAPAEAIFQLNVFARKFCMQVKTISYSRKYCAYKSANLQLKVKLGISHNIAIGFR
jgi:hypothetical protein